MNFPADVRGIASTNSNASGSQNFANCGARNSRSSAGVALAPGFKTTAASGRSSHFGWATGNHRRLGDRRVAHQRALERHGADPLAAGLDQILRPILHWMVPSSSIVTMSPVLNQPSSVKRSAQSSRL